MTIYENGGLSARVDYEGMYINSGKNCYDVYEGIELNQCRSRVGMLLVYDCENKYIVTCVDYKTELKKSDLDENSKFIYDTLFKRIKEYEKTVN